MGNYAWGYLRKVSFFHKLETWEKTMLGFGFIFTQAWNGNKLCLVLVSFLYKLETKINYAWDEFAFPCWKMATRNAKNRSAKNNTAKNSNLGTSVGLGNREWKMEVIKIEVLFLAVQVDFYF